MRPIVVSRQPLKRRIPEKPAPLAMLGVVS
jgi:hypothetical protein